MIIPSNINLNQRVIISSDSSYDSTMFIYKIIRVYGPEGDHLGALQSHKYTQCIPHRQPTREKYCVLIFRYGELELRTEFHNSCNHIEDSFCQEMVDLLLRHYHWFYYSWIISVKPKQTRRNLRYRKPGWGQTNTSSFPAKLLYYK